MKEFFTKEVFANRIVLAAVGVVIVVAVGSSIYYAASSREPSPNVSTEASSTEAAVVGNGTVEPAQNPNLAFESGGRVSSVAVTVGDKVSQGQVLASLDTASLSAQRAQAQANVDTQEANLAQMQAGPRQVDVDAKQTAVSQAQTALTNLYANAPANIAQAYDESFSGVSASTDTLFSQPNSSTPTLGFSTSNSQLGFTAVSDRVEVNGELATWESESNALSSASSPQTIDTELAASIAHLQAVRTYADAVLEALGNATPSTNFPQASVSAAQTAVGAFRNTINGLILTLQGQQQQIASDKLAVQSAQDALNQTLAGSTPQDIEAQEAQVAAAQASVANINAQISNGLVVAPFAGTVASVQVKKGDIVSPGAVAVALNPESALQIVVYFSEIDITKVKAGAAANVTLDAYGNSQVFPAQVVSVDTSPTAQLGYKATLQFLKSDPAISSGMTANVTIPITQ